MNNYYVQLIEINTEKVIKEMGPHTKSQAEKIESGADRNLNHEKFCTKIVQKNGNNNA